MRPFFLSILLILMIPLVVHAQLPVLTAKGVAVYGWRNGQSQVLYQKNQHRLYPIASITKLVTAKTVKALYAENKVFSISPTAIQSSGSIPGIVTGAQFTRDDLLKALLISSSNDVAWALLEPVGRDAFIKEMNAFLHREQYTSRSFVNATGLDPLKITHLTPNRLTPYQLSRLVSDIYLTDPLLAGIMAKETGTIHDLANGGDFVVTNTNELYTYTHYKEKILMSKTGHTKHAGENLTFVTKREGRYDYLTVVLLASQNRERDGQRVLDWIEML